jgi:hypothetical protein
LPFCHAPGEPCQHIPYSDAQPADTRLAGTFAGLDRDAGSRSSSISLVPQRSTAEELNGDTPMSAPAIWHQVTWGFRRKSRCCQPLIRSRTSTVRAGKLSWSPDAPVGAAFADVQVQRKLPGTPTEGYA